MITISTWKPVSDFFGKMHIYMLTENKFTFLSFSRLVKGGNGKQTELRRL